MARSDDGQALRLNRVDAARFCDDRGGRLPTIRELAAALNPNGVSDVFRSGRVGISPEDEPRFFYDFNAYSPPTGEAAGFKYWSASNSALPELPTAEKFGFVFWAGNGSIDESFSSVYNLAQTRCVPAPRGAARF